MESILESTPQIVIQLFYIIKTNSTSFVVYVSSMWSLYTIASKAITEDKLHFKKEYQSWHDCKNYLKRAGYRIVDITYRVSVTLLIWLILGGEYAFLVVLFEFVAVLVICKKTDDYTFLNCIILTPLVQARDCEHEVYIKIVRYYRRVSNIIFVITICINGFIEFECPSYRFSNVLNGFFHFEPCVDYATRHNILVHSNHGFVLILLFYTIFLSYFFDSITDYVIKHMIDSQAGNNIDNSDRNLIGIIKSHQWKDILELMLFGVKFELHDKGSQSNQKEWDDAYMHILRYGDGIIFEQIITQRVHNSKTNQTLLEYMFNRVYKRQKWGDLAMTNTNRNNAQTRTTIITTTATPASNNSGGAGADSVIGTPITTLTESKMELKMDSKEEEEEETHFCIETMDELEKIYQTMNNIEANIGQLEEEEKKLQIHEFQEMIAEKKSFCDLCAAVTVIYEIIYEQYGKDSELQNIIKYIWKKHKRLILEKFSVKILFDQMLKCFEQFDTPYRYEYHNIFYDICYNKASQLHKNKYPFEEIYRMGKTLNQPAINGENNFDKGLVSRFRDLSLYTTEMDELGLTTEENKDFMYHLVQASQNYFD